MNTPRIIGLAGLLLLAACGDKDSDIGSEVVNGEPIAEAGPNQVLPADSEVRLSGAGSSDPDGDPLSYQWTFLSVPQTSALSGGDGFSANGSSAALATTFRPDAIGTYVIELVVNDGQADSSPDVVTITAQDPADIPVADAGIDRTVNVSELVELDGSRSYDRQGRPLTYHWSFVEVSELSGLTDGSISGADSVSASFTPDAHGVYIVNLVVNNGLTDSAADAAVFTVLGNDGVPVPNPGEDRMVEDCTTVQLDGSGSADPDGDSLRYFWTVQTVPEGSSVNSSSFSDRAVAQPTIWLDIAGVYVVSLAVYDGNTWSNASLVTLTAEERSFNTPPTVTITPWETIAAGDAECTLNGYNYTCDDCPDQTVEFGGNVVISDAENDPYTLVWELTAGDGEIDDPNSLVTEVTFEDAAVSTISTCDDNEYELTLTVVDCPGATVTTATPVVVQCCGVEETDSN